MLALIRRLVLTINQSIGGAVIGSLLCCGLLSIVAACVPSGTFIPGMAAISAATGATLCIVPPIFYPCKNEKDVKKDEKYNKKLADLVSISLFINKFKSTYLRTFLPLTTNPKLLGYIKSMESQGSEMEEILGKMLTGRAPTQQQMYDNVPKYNPPTLR